jgi:glycosyltransferase involved in cell wall biosynthesis
MTVSSEKAIKVLYILPDLNIYGGVPKKTILLLENLRDNAVVFVYSEDYIEYSYLFSQYGGTVICEKRSSGLFLHLFSILRITHFYNINIVHSQFFYGKLLLFLLKFLNKKVKTVLSFVNGIELSSRKKYIIKLLMRMTTCRSIDRVIYISEFVKIQKEKEYPDLKLFNSEVIYNGISLDISEISGIKYQVNQRFSIVGIGGLTANKNYIVVLQAIKILVLDMRLSVHLTILGDGENKELLDKYISDNHLSAYISLLGYTDNVYRFLETASVFVHPCINEGFGLSVVESMLSGIPVIVSNTGALPELVDNGITGFTANPFDAMDWVEKILIFINDTNLRVKMATACRETATKRFSKDRFVKNYIRLYENILNEV